LQLLYKAINWYTQRFPFPFKGQKYFLSLLKRTGNDHKTYLKKIHNGLLMEVNSQDLLQQQILWYGFYEKKYIVTWERMIQKDSIVLDIGANIGYYSLVASKKALDGHVYAFEPTSTAFEQLQKNIALNKFENVSAFKTAVFDSSGERTLFISEKTNSGMGGLTQPVNFTGKTEEVNTTQIDDWMEIQKPGRIDFIKIDIEGAELNALKGMSKLLEKYQPTIFIEIFDPLLTRFGHDHIEIYKLLNDLDYQAFDLDRKGQLVPLQVPMQGELIIFRHKKTEFPNT
jgi:FkbM family methyltransferase